MQKRTFITTVFGLAAAFLMAASAQAQVAGKDYVAISPPQPTENPAKIEVIEFFSYGCPHCKDFHPLISKWAAKLPSDVVFKRVPISFGRPQWASLARLYYALEATGDLAKLDSAVFLAIHEQRVPFKTDEAVVTWAAGKGVDGKKFGDALASFSMQSKVQRADQEAAAARISGVPSLAVDGKFLINNEAAGNYEELLKLTDAIIEKARKERKGK